MKIEALSCQNVTEKVNFITDVSELQDEARPKSIAPSPTAQTTGKNWLNFFMEASLDDTFTIIEAIFEFRPRS